MWPWTLEGCSESKSVWAVLEWTGIHSWQSQLNFSSENRRGLLQFSAEIFLDAKPPGTLVSALPSIKNILLCELQGSAALAATKDFSFLIPLWLDKEFLKGKIQYLSFPLICKIWSLILQDWSQDRCLDTVWQDGGGLEISVSIGCSHTRTMSVENDFLKFSFGVFGGFFGGFLSFGC